jgi:hypothetical protein
MWGAMASGKSVVTRERVELAGDALLITSALFGLLTAGVLGIATMVWKTDFPVWLQLLSSLVILAAGIGGPAATWLLHGRRITVPALIGAVLGAPVAGAVVMGFILLSWPLGWLVSPISRSEFAGPIALLVLVGILFTGAMTWLVVDAVRDFVPTRREHARLDVIRVVGFLVLVALGAATAVIALNTSNGEIVEAPVFAVVAGVSAAVSVTVADLATRLLAPKPEAEATAE